MFDIQRPQGLEKLLVFVSPWQIVDLLNSWKTAVSGVLLSSNPPPPPTTVLSALHSTGQNLERSGEQKPAPTPAFPGVQGLGLI